MTKTNRSFGCASFLIISGFSEKIHRFLQKESNAVAELAVVELVETTKHSAQGHLPVAQQPQAQPPSFSLGKPPSRPSLN